MRREHLSVTTAIALLCAAMLSGAYAQGVGDCRTMFDRCKPPLTSAAEPRVYSVGLSRP